MEQVALKGGMILKHKQMKLQNNNFPRWLKNN